MWTCPKCGRTFKRHNQGHYCGKALGTIDAYIEAQPEEAWQYLKWKEPVISFPWMGKDSGF